MLFSSGIVLWHVGQEVEESRTPLRSDCGAGPSESILWPSVIGGLVCEKGSKGVRRMPRLSQAMKGVISCDKPGAGASDH